MGCCFGVLTPFFGLLRVKIEFRCPGTHYAPLGYMGPRLTA